MAASLSDNVPLETVSTTSSAREANIHSGKENVNLDLDFTLEQYNKLYICDILKLEEKLPGIFFYKNHPMQTVEITGVVVKVSHNSKFYIYEVDDGTGVLTCCVWIASNNEHEWIDVDDLPEALRQKAQDLNEEFEGEKKMYSLGDMIQMRGKLRVFRDQLEIVSHYHAKVDDPFIEILQATELPKLYRQYYDKEFILPARFLQETGRSPNEDRTISQGQIISTVQKAISRYLQDHNICEVTAEELLSSTEIQNVLSKEADEKEDIVRKALSYLEKTGELCCSMDQSPIYQVLSNASISPLEKAIKTIMARASSSIKYQETGSHVLYIYGELQKSKQYCNINKNCVDRCLQKLENRSEVICISYKHYVLCD